MPLKQPAGLGVGNVEEIQKGVGAAQQTAVLDDRSQATMTIERHGRSLPYGIIGLLAVLVVFLSFAIIAAHSVGGEAEGIGK
jgi:hypothetical protein